MQKKVQKAEDPQEKEAREAAERQLLEEAVENAERLRKDAADEAAAAAAAEEAAKAEAEASEDAASQGNCLQLPAPSPSQEQPSEDGPQEPKKPLRLKERKALQEKQAVEDRANAMLRGLQNRGLKAAVHEAKTKVRSAEKAKRLHRAPSTGSDVLEDPPAAASQPPQSSGSSMSLGKVSPSDSRSNLRTRYFPRKHAPGTPPKDTRFSATNRRGPQQQPCSCSDSDAEIDIGDAGPGPSRRVYPAARLQKGLKHMGPGRAGPGHDLTNPRLHGDHQHHCHHDRCHPGDDQMTRGSDASRALPNAKMTDLLRTWDDFSTKYEIPAVQRSHRSAGPAERLSYKCEDPMCTEGHSHGQADWSEQQQAHSHVAPSNSQLQHTLLQGVPGYDRERDSSWEEIDVSSGSRAPGEVRDATGNLARRYDAEHDPPRRKQRTGLDSQTCLAHSATSGGISGSNSNAHGQKDVHSAAQGRRQLQAGAKPGPHSTGPLQDEDEGPYLEMHQEQGAWSDDEEESGVMDAIWQHFSQGSDACDAHVITPQASSPAGRLQKGLELTRFLQLGGVQARGLQCECHEDGTVGVWTESPPTSPSSADSHSHQQLQDSYDSHRSDRLRNLLLARLEQIDDLEAGLEAELDASMEADLEADFDAALAPQNLQMSHEDEASSSSQRYPRRHVGSEDPQCGIQSPRQHARRVSHADLARFQNQQDWASGEGDAGHLFSQQQGASCEHDATWDGRMSERTQSYSDPAGLPDGFSDPDDSSDWSEVAPGQDLPATCHLQAAKIEQVYIRCTRLLRHAPLPVVEFFHLQYETLMQQPASLQLSPSQAADLYSSLQLKTCMPTFDRHVKVYKVIVNLHEQDKLTVDILRKWSPGDSNWQEAEPAAGALCIARAAAQQQWHPVTALSMLDRLHSELVELASQHAQLELLRQECTPV